MIKHSDMTGADCNLSQIRTILLAEGMSFRTISFDVFDTLIQRTLPHPDTTKIPAAKELLGLSGSETCKLQLDGLLRMRLQVEASLRQKAASQGNDPEFHIESLFREWISAFNREPDQKTIDHLIEIELQAELAVSFSTPGMLELIQDLEKKGAHLVFASDMYYSQKLIYRILEHCGYGGCFKRGYVSSELHKAKYSGKLFKHILSTEQLAPNELVHVGDNLEADVNGPKKCGVSAIQFRDRAVQSMHSSQSYLLRLSEKNSFWKGARWQAWSIASRAHRQRAEHDALYGIGYEYLGALLTNFVHRLINRAVIHKPEILLFCAREGFLLGQLYSLLVESLQLTDAPKSKYAFLNRKSVYTASLHEIGKRELDMGFHTTSPTLRNMLVRFSLPAEEILDLAKKAGIGNPDTPIKDPNNSPELKGLLELPDLRKILKECRRQSDNLLTKYLESLGFWTSSRVGLVDVGWNGTVQEALSVAFRNRPDCPEMYGYYMALFGNKQYSPATNTYYEGIYYDYRSEYPSVAFHRFVELFETACRAPHPTTAGFAAGVEGDVVPVFEDVDSVAYQRERVDEKWVATIQSGILDYCEDYLKSIPFRNVAPEQESAFILSRFERLLHFPTREESDLLTRFGHSEGFGQSLVFVPEDGAEGFMNSSKRKLVNQRVLWTEAALVKKRIPGLNTLFNAARLVKSRYY